jgi:hypothetical protein
MMRKGGLLVACSCFSMLYLVLLFGALLMNAAPYAQSK